MAAIDPHWTVVAQRVKNLLNVAEQLGANRRDLMTRTAIREEWLINPDARLPVSCLFDLFEQASIAVANPDIGLYAGRVEFFTGQHLLHYMSTLCKTFRDYLKLIPSLRKSHGDVGEVRIVKGEKDVRLEWHPLLPDTARLRYLSDEILCLSAMQLNVLCLYPIPVLRADFTYPEPKDLTLLRQTFGDNLHFAQPVSCFYFEPVALDYPLIRAGHTLHEDIIHSMQAYFEDGPVDGFLRTLRDCLARLLPTDEFGIDAVAKHLTISRRTLQRRLAERGTHFQQVLQEVRAGLAIRYLADKRIGITEIAFLLGYAESASFTRAFRQWYGVAPSDYRH